MKNMKLRPDDETHRQARVRAAKQELTASALVKQLLAADIETEATGVPSPAFMELAAERRALTGGSAHTPAEVLQREGRAER
jgi:plasmid stability protein